MFRHWVVLDRKSYYLLLECPYKSWSVQVYLLDKLIFEDADLSSFRRFCSRQRRLQFKSRILEPAKL